MYGLPFVDSCKRKINDTLTVSNKEYTTANLDNTY